MIDYMAWLDHRKGSGPNILIFAGQWDNRDGPVTIEPWITQTFNFKAKDLYALDRQIYYVNASATNVYTGGYYRRTPNGKYTLMTVPKAGHYVPTDVLDVTKWMLTDMINNGSLQCHNNKDGCSTAHYTCSYMNHCSGNGVCSKDNGRCQCNPGYASADCSKRVEVLTSFYLKQIPVQGAQWTYFTYTEGLYYQEGYEFTLTSSNPFVPMDIYITTGAPITEKEPNEFNYDVVFRKQSYLKLTQDMFGANPIFSVAVLVNGLDTYNNATNQTTVSAGFKLINLSTG